MRDAKAPLTAGGDGGAAVDGFFSLSDSESVIWSGSFGEGLTGDASRGEASLTGGGGGGCCCGVRFGADALRRP